MRHNRRFPKTLTPLLFLAGLANSPILFKGSAGDGGTSVQQYPTMLPAQGTSSSADSPCPEAAGPQTPINTGTYTTAQDCLLQFPAAEQREECSGCQIQLMLSSESCNVTGSGTVEVWQQIASIDSIAGMTAEEVFEPGSYSLGAVSIGDAVEVVAALTPMTCQGPLVFQICLSSEEESDEDFQFTQDETCGFILSWS